MITELKYCPVCGSENVDLCEEDYFATNDIAGETWQAYRQSCNEYKSEWIFNKPGPGYTYKWTKIMVKDNSRWTDRKKLEAWNQAVEGE